MTIITPAEIYKRFQEGKLDKDTLIYSLIHLIESGAKEYLREDAFRILEGLGVNNEDIFKFLEETFLTEWNIVIRIRAVKWLLRDFPKRCLSLIESLVRRDFFPVSMFELIWRSENPLFDGYKEELYSRIEGNIQEHVDDGLIYEDAFVLALMEKNFGSKLEKINYDEDIRFRDGWQHYKMSRDAHILRFYISPHSDSYDFLFIPESIEQLKHLEELFMIGCTLEMIPESIGELKTLKCLGLGVNWIQTIPESIGGLTSLEELDLSHNKIEVIPESIGNLKLLKVLNLAENKIEKIPESISNLRSLKVLKLNGNLFESFPDSIGDLQALEKLDLGWNKINKLPSSLSSLKNLKELNLRGNNIKSIPKSLNFIKTIYI